MRIKHTIFQKEGKTMNSFKGQMEKYAGVYSLLLTPYNDDLSVDFEALKGYTEWQVQENPHALFPVCGSSEMAKLELDERLKIAETVVKYANGKPVFATGNLSVGTREEQIEEVKRMSATGVDGLVFVTKGYGLDDDYIVHYMCSLAEHTELPILIYEFPGFPNNKISADAYKKLVETGKFVGMKDTTCSMELIKKKIEIQGESNVLQANIPYLFESYKAGARGVIATPSTCGTYMLRKMYDAFFVENDIEKAEKIHRFVDVFAETVDNGFTASAKYMATLCGAKMNTYTRTGASINDQKKHSLKVLHDFAVSEGLMIK